MPDKKGQALCDPTDVKSPEEPTPQGQEVEQRLPGAEGGAAAGMLSYGLRGSEFPFGVRKRFQNSERLHDDIVNISNDTESHTRKLTWQVIF